MVFSGADPLALALAVAFLAFFAGFATGRRRGKKEGFVEGLAYGPLELRRKAWEDGRCAVCGAGTGEIVAQVPLDSDGTTRYDVSNQIP